MVTQRPTAPAAGSLADRTDVDSVAIQTVGSRGYDGFISAVMTDDSRR